MVPKSSLILSPVLASLALCGCATDPGRYPSLAIRDQERVSGTIQPAEPVEPVPTPPDPEVLGRLGALRATAAQANERFLAAAGRAQRLVAAARGAEPGSIGWSAAQIALGEAESSRSDATVALAELDRLYLEARLDGRDASEVGQARDEVSALVGSQTRRLDELHGALGG